MTVYVALLRAVNVGGTGKLPMEQLREMCNGLGFSGVKTYIASGNVVFGSGLFEAEVKAALEASLKGYAGKPVGVIVRTAAEIAEVVKRNPFPELEPNRTVAIFLDQSPPANCLEQVRGRRDELIEPGNREVYVYYGSGMAESKLVIPAAKNGTGRNINTITRLAAMANEL